MGIKRIDLNDKLLDFPAPNEESKREDGLIEREWSLASYVGNMLKQSGEGDALKTFSWMQSLAKDGTIELDAQDLKFLRDQVQNATIFFNLVKAQVLQKLDAAKDQPDSPEVPGPQPHPNQRSNRATKPKNTKSAVEHNGE